MVFILLFLKKIFIEDEIIENIKKMSYFLFVSLCLQALKYGLQNLNSLILWNKSFFPRHLGGTPQLFPFKKD